MLQERSNLRGEDLGIAAPERLGFLAPAELAKEAPASGAAAGGARREARDGVCLQVLGPLEPAEMRDELLFVARGEQRVHQQDVGDLGVDGPRGLLTGVHEHQVRAHEAADDVRQDVSLPGIGFDCQYERHSRVPFSRVLPDPLPRLPRPPYVLNMNTNRMAPATTKTSTGAFSML
jgi:hypothetical protein